jgi:O-antigen ligase
MLLIASSLLGGYRSAMISFILVSVIQTYFEGMFSTRLFLALALGAILSGALLVPFVQKLPLSVQRSLSFLPLDLNPAVRADAQASVDWRLDMWRSLLPLVPKYFIKGKGYAIGPADLYLAQEGAKRGLVKNNEVSLIAGDYHNGPLSILIPFGIFGVIGFLAVIGAGARLLYRNYRFGNPVLKGLNTFLLSYFLARFIFFLFFGGGFHADIAFFLGLVALSVSLNGCEPQASAGNQEPTTTA